MESDKGGASVLRTARVHPIAQERHLVFHRKPAKDLLQIRKGGHSHGKQDSPASFDTELQQLHLGVHERIETRGREKESMNELNEKLADYVEKVRFLDAQNKRLSRELNVLRDRYGSETAHVRALYECEAKNISSLAEKSRGKRDGLQAELDKSSGELDQQLAALRDLQDNNKRNRDAKKALNQQLADLEADLALLRRRSNAFDDEKKQDKAEINYLKSEENTLKKDVEDTVQHRFRSDLEANLLRDMLEATESGHLLRWQELANEASKDSTSENKEAWQSEFKKKLKKIQEEYDERIVSATDEINESLQIKLSENLGNANRQQFEAAMIKKELQTMGSRLGELQNRINSLQFEINQYETQIVDLEASISAGQSAHQQELVRLRGALEERQSNCSQAKAELQKFFDMKLSTEIELAAYRTLLQSDSVTHTLDAVGVARDDKVRGNLRYFSTHFGGYLNESESLSNIQQK